MIKYSENAQRLYKLLSDLPPDLLKDALPEVDSSPASPVRPPKPPLRRLIRATLLYAACAVLVLAASLLLPKLFDQSNAPITQPPAVTNPYPTDVNECWDVTTLTPAPQRIIFSCIESHVEEPSLKPKKHQTLSIEYTYHWDLDTCRFTNHNIHAYSTDSIDYLEVYLYGAWYQVPKAQTPPEPSSEFIPMEEGIPIQKDFHFDYGELPPGTYRAVVSFSTINTGNDYHTEGYVYTEFVIENYPLDDLPEDYFRPDLVWANEKNDPRRAGAKKGDYTSIEFDFVSDPNAVYAIYLICNNAWIRDGSILFLETYPLDLPEDKEYLGLSYRKSGWRKVLGSAPSDFRIHEDNDITLYAATQQQIKQYCAYLEQALAKEGDEGRQIQIHLAYQSTSSLYLDGQWNPDALKQVPTHADAPCIASYYADTSEIRYGEQTSLLLTFEFTPYHGHYHTTIFEYFPDENYCWRLEVKLGDNWHTVPVKDKQTSIDALNEALRDSNLKHRHYAQATFSLSTELYGNLPAGLYRVATQIGGTPDQDYMWDSPGDIPNTVYIPFTIVS